MHMHILQESLADAKVSARQQCVYEGPQRRNLSSAENPTLKPNIRRNFRGYGGTVPPNFQAHVRKITVTIH